MIVLEGVSRWYGQVIGVNDVSCMLKPGLVALLGQNGAGKTTLLRMITGQLRPTTGRLTVFGEEPFANPNVLKRIGYCPDVDNFYENSTGRAFIQFLAELGGMPKKLARERTEEMLQVVGMSHAADRRIAGYSKGMRQRIKLAQAMIHNPDVIVLDEPLNGLDPVGRHEYIAMLHSLANEGRLIVVSSHILYEVETMTKSLLLLHRGRLLAEGDLRVIRSLIDQHPHRVRVEGPVPRAIAQATLGLPNVLSLDLREQEGYVEIEVTEPEMFYRELSEMVLSGKVELTGFSSPDNNLESVFRYLVTT
ncbi:MAG TPA: ABC transporter ATP-binding protein [Fimbriimonadaceae bacterium]|nr:ABC transporter ATP-binding protein [Fimbriimonadaceae bacterium]